jgi:hypothetical protein
MIGILKQFLREKIEVCIASELIADSKKQANGEASICLKDPPPA